jgi:hypothetical protein
MYYFEDTLQLRSLFVPAELKGKEDNTNAYFYNVITFHGIKNESSLHK